jgi:hypothetical protein
MQFRTDLILPHRVEAAGLHSLIHELHRGVELQILELLEVDATRPVLT